ncbi:ATP-binding protein [Erythrobacter sp. SDW2]|uniref:sensor histidine kinase n=1 Tax=Erythrobacter sp. SDW2 TaxID=2907154 RepID=UPI001F3CDEA2|nr:ATP-binding protein [Erythrobacter sp. SDW2]UIP06347.1 ATP-binding protein [Erythrobacter sp. SDW2]
MTNKSIAGLAFDVGVFLAATSATWLAQHLERPITAVLAYLTGVIMIAVYSGLARAMVAAVCASIVYNFFLSEPVFQFGITTADETVPLIAFNVSALVAGFLVGRLRDFANDALAARQETQFLLAVSDHLQKAIRVEEVEDAIRKILPAQGLEDVKVFIAHQNAFVRPANGEVELNPLQPLLEDTARIIGSRRWRICELQGARGSLGMAKFQLADFDPVVAKPERLQSLAALIGVAVERCLLLDEVAEARTAARSEELKDAILSSVSHDLRTPITVIETAAGALASRDVVLKPVERDAMFASILEQCRRLDRYTSQLLDVGRIQAGISKLRTETVDVAEIAQLAIRHAKTARPDLAVEREFPDERQFVLANAGMLEHALFNLLDNAAKFGARDSAVKVVIKREGEQVAIAVVDRGPGIPEVEQDKIFDRFHMGQRDGKGASVGLGLFIAKGFVEAANGRITVTSPVHEGRGTCIAVRLPVFESPEEKAVPQ